MAVRKLRANQRGPRCEWCNNRATHRGYGHSLGCDTHLPELERQDKRDSAPDFSDAAFYGRYQ
jgi:hypothetical protein